MDGAAGLRDAPARSGCTEKAEAPAAKASSAALKASLPHMMWFDRACDHLLQEVLL
jgi:hypothetical protein